MKYMHSEWRERLEHWDNTLKQDIYRPMGEIHFEGCLTMEHLSLDEARKLTFQPMPAAARTAPPSPAPKRRESTTAQPVTQPNRIA